MSERFLRCPHCRAPHDARVTVCPTTRKRIAPSGSSDGPRETRPPTASAPPPAAHALQTPNEKARAKRDELIGKTLGGRYVIHGVLGEGGMGTVYDAEHVALKRPVAVKVLNPTQAAKSTAVKRFQHEARAAGGIGHPNICEVYDLGQLDDGSPYLVMEKLVGQTLSDVIKRSGPLPFATAAEIVFQVLAGLAAAHDKGIVHRDIKPENVFLTERVGLPEIVKLLDFGVSKMVIRGPDENTEDFDLTRTGMVMGTPYYMSPEQARGDRNLDARVDLYACGIVLYESLTAKRPFVAQNYNALLIAILSGKPRPITELRPDVPPPFARVIAKAMARARSDRYQSAAELQRDLLPLRGDLTGIPPPPNVLERERARVRLAANAAAAAAAAANAQSVDRIGSSGPPEMRASAPSAPSEQTRIEGRAPPMRAPVSSRPNAGALPAPHSPPSRPRTGSSPSAEPPAPTASEWEEDAPTEIMRSDHRPRFDRPSRSTAPSHPPPPPAPPAQRSVVADKAARYSPDERLGGGPGARVAPRGDVPYAGGSRPSTQASDWVDKTEIVDHADDDVELVSELSDGDETERRESPFERQSRRR